MASYLELSELKVNKTYICELYDGELVVVKCIEVTDDFAMFEDDEFSDRRTYTTNGDIRYVFEEI